MSTKISLSLLCLHCLATPGNGTLLWSVVNVPHEPPLEKTKCFLCQRVSVTDSFLLWSGSTCPLSPSALGSLLFLKDRVRTIHRKSWISDLSWKTNHALWHLVHFCVLTVGTMLSWGCLCLRLCAVQSPNLSLSWQPLLQPTSLAWLLPLSSGDSGEILDEMLNFWCKGCWRAGLGLKPAFWHFPAGTS